MNKKLKLAILLFFLGFLGVLSTLTMDIPIPETVQKKVSESFTAWQFKLFSLINPTILLLIAVTIGTLLYDKVNLKLPIIERLIYRDKRIRPSGILQYGIIGGVIGGVLILLTTIAFTPLLPAEFIIIGEKFKPTLLARFLYGGFTEEILIRLGVMSFLVWLIYRISGKLTPTVYWFAIIVSAITFGFGHLPIVYAMIGMPTTELLFYIIFGNAVGGIVFGWLYWKKGLEAAMIAHIFAHVILLTGENVFHI